MNTPSAVRPQSGPDVYIRRRPALERFMALPFVAVAGFFGAFLLVQVVNVLAGAVPAVGLSAAALLPMLAVGLLGAVLGLTVYRPCLVADASGLHVRGVLSRHDLPWPASRGELVVVPAFGLISRAGAMAVQYRPADGSRAVTIHALARPVLGWSGCPSADEEAVDLWEWAESRGYVGAVRTPAAGAGAGVGTGAAPTRTGHVDPAVLRQEVLYLSAWRTSRGPFMGVLCMLGLVLAGIVVTFLNPKNDLDLVGAVIGFLVFGTLTLVIVIAARSTTTIDVEGFHVGGLGRVDLPWPRSRSDLYVQVASTGRRSSGGACVLVRPDGQAVTLPGSNGGRGEGGALRVWELSESIWAWGVAHGVAEDDGGYHPCTNRAMEERRRRSMEYLEAERARLSRAD